MSSEKTTQPCPLGEDCPDARKYGSVHPKPDGPIAVPKSWLADAVKLLNEMAGEGICMEGCADPADLMTDIGSHLGLDEEDDLWEAAVRKLQDA